MEKHKYFFGCKMVDLKHTFNMLCVAKWRECSIPYIVGVRYYHGWVKYYHGLRTMVLFMKQLDDSTGGRVAERKNQGQKSLALANMVKGVNFNCELISSL